MTPRLSRFALLAVLMFTNLGQAGEDYYLLMFGSQRTPTNPRYSHSFATFVRVTWLGDGPCPANPILEEHTISWLPANGIIRLYTLHAECGRNFDLHTTMQWNLDNDMRTSLWGPYRIQPELYHLALNQVGVLGSGQVRYKALDMGHRTDRVSNCIHAASSIVAGYRLRVGTPGWGETASWAILQRYEPYVIQPGRTYPWVGSALGLDKYPLIYRDWQRPFSGLIGPAYRLLGGEHDLHSTYGPPANDECGCPLPPP